MTPEKEAKRKPSRCKCGVKTLRNDKYDAYFCPTCLIWTESKCSDKTCIFCSIRPETPDGTV